MYAGTELDISLSTIKEGADTESVISSAVTTASSITSVDDRAFKDGLASLDANIARIQAQLKQTLSSVSNATSDP